MKYLFTVLLFLFLFSFESSAYTLYWFSGAGISKPAKEIASLYNKTHKNRVVVVTGGSGEMLNKMIESKTGDIYSFVDYMFLDKALKYKVVSVYKKILKLTPVFLVSQGESGSIKSLQDLAKMGVKIAGGNKKAMCLGRTYEEIMDKLPKNLSRKLRENVIVRCMNVFQIVGYVKSGTVGAGLILDKALVKDEKFGCIEIPKKYNVERYGYLSLVAYSKNSSAQKDLFNFILKHKSVYAKYGFKILGGE